MLYPPERAIGLAQASFRLIALTDPSLHYIQTHRFGKLPTRWNKWLCVVTRRPNLTEKRKSKEWFIAMLGFSGTNLSDLISNRYGHQSMIGFMFSLSMASLRSRCGGFSWMPDLIPNFTLVSKQSRHTLNVFDGLPKLPNHL